MGSNMDHGAQNPDNLYCVHCTDLKGKLLPFETVYQKMVAFAMETRWMNKEQAQKYALDEMGKWPAWRDKVSQMARPA